MEFSEDEFQDIYDEIELDEETARLLDQAPVDLGALHPLSDFGFGSEAYCNKYKTDLALEARQRTGLNPFDWQLDVTLNSHLGRDVFLLAGTGSGKTLALVMYAFMDPTLKIFLVSPLNALANSQVQDFAKWNIKAVAVNATTKCKNLKKDILRGEFQIIISSIEAFTDTTRLLPIVKSPELAALGPQRIVIDEAHCIPKWGQNFRPQYALVRTLKLLLTGEVSMIAATATANNLMRQAIKQSLRFGPDAFEVNLGNRCPGIAYYVYRVMNVSAIATELLKHFRSKSSLSGFTIIFVDSRKLGESLLTALREHLDPELRGAVQLYHASRSEFDKKILAAGFEREDGFGVLFFTEALTMGLNFLKVTRVIQVLAPTDAETLVQRMGRCGRTKGTIGHAILLAQDSLFEDSKAGQKRLLKNIKQEESIPTEKKQGKNTKIPTGNDKARRIPKEYSKDIIDFINTTGCRVAVLDKVFDNTPRPAGEICLCDNCARERGEETYKLLHFVAFE